MPHLCTEFCFLGFFPVFSGKLAFFPEPTKDSPTYPVLFQLPHVEAPLTPYFFQLPHVEAPLTPYFLEPKRTALPSLNLAHTPDSTPPFLSPTYPVLFGTQKDSPT